MASILVPVAYIFIVFGGLFVFSYFYRKHTSTRVYEPYFPSHPERNAYVTLLQQDPPASDSLLKAALVRRAMADVQRVLRIREDKPALQALLQKGSIGDDLWNSLLAAEKELEAEVMEVVQEANSFVEGWGQVIFPTANEMLANERMRAIWENTEKLKSELELKYDVKAKFQLTPVQGPPPSTPTKSNGLTPPTPTASEQSITSDGEGTPKSAKSKRRK
ncbi:translocation protein sec66 [Coprinopsis cinerea okayama7|uniref:Translocation protein sec66 n=1 Tax=Coprinopsis cinerea (strain Okayama-7 / 130 / ATCC MYA-4618 / FGSC 9003) TaxID=240176 RepID=A8NFU2_COPC7|nr:translocation protein sec66 [Coprinopsis cinerea okayama7\|eukprot:XP_001833369.1 translocation protein sec66 [Coprinopsis cinerea okayama7\